MDEVSGMAEVGVELAREVAKQAVKEMETDRSFAMELVANARRDSKRWFTIALVILSFWFATIGIFIYYLSLYDFSSTTTEYTADTDDGGNASIIGGNGDISNGYGEIEESCQEAY